MVKNIGFMKNKYLIVIALLAVLASCKKDETVEVTKYYVGDEAKSWLVDECKKEYFMLDENGIEQGIYVREPVVEYTKDTTLGVLRERIAQYSYPDVGDGKGFGVYITAGKDNKPNVDESFAIIFNGCYFSFDGNGFRPMSSEPRSEIEYTAELLDAFEVNGVTYHDVLRIQQVESRALSSRGPVELYYAKHYGMIQYTIPYGITYFRLPAE